MDIKTVQSYKSRLVRILKKTGKYNDGLLITVEVLANTMRTLSLCRDEIDGLDKTTVVETTRYGQKLAPHPVFKVQRDAQDSLARLCKTLGLTYTDLMKDIEGDGLEDFMERIKGSEEYSSMKNEE